MTNYYNADEGNDCLDLRGELTDGVLFVRLCKKHGVLLVRM